MPIDLSNNIVHSSGVTENGIYVKKIVRSGLKIFLDAANFLSYTGGTGVWRDLSGYNNHCYWDVVNPPAWLPNNYGLFSFNGTTDYGTIYNNDSLDFSREQTVMMVLYKVNDSVRRNPWDQAYGGYGTWTDEDTPDDYIAHYFGDAGSNTTPYTRTQSEGRPINTWKIAAITRDTQRQISYMDGRRGTRFGTSTTAGASEVIHTYGTLTSDTNNIRIGNGYAGYWAGYIAVVLAYTRALHPYEIAQNFQSLRGRYGL